jgi:hypothetical protein
MSIRTVAAVLFTITALAGCATAAGGGSSNSSAALAGPGQNPQRLDYSGAAGGSGKQVATIIAGTPPSSDVERSVSAAYTVPAGSFLTSFEGVIAGGVALGGYVVSSSTEPDGAGRIVRGSVTIKVPAPKVADLLNGMPSSFVASAINFAAVDHTAQFVDVNARLASAHARLAALDGLLAKATSITDITTLEQEIETVQTEVDTDQGQLNVLTNSVELATATVQMSERGAVVAALPNPVSSGLGGGWDNAVRVTGAILDGLVTALPLLVVVGAGLAVWRRVRPQPARRQGSAAE